MKASIQYIKDISDNIRILAVRPDSTFTYIAGQYIEISFGGLPYRPYSIANRPAAGHDLEIHIKRGSGATTHYAFEKLTNGEVIDISRPNGTSVYDDARAFPLLAIAGGLGITPLKAIIETALENHHTAPIYLFWGASNPADLYLDAYFRTLENGNAHFHFIPVTAEPVGHVAARWFEDLMHARIYIAGGQEMIKVTTGLLSDKGAREESMSYDNYESAISGEERPS